MLRNRIKCLLLLSETASSLVQPVFSTDVPWYQPTTITHLVATE